MEENNYSRRDFLKTGSIFWLSTVILNDPIAKAFANEVGLGPQLQKIGNFSCEIFRPADLLHLKYFFFNARISCHHIKPVSKSAPIYIYVMVSSQHIAEQLVSIDYSGFANKNQFTRQLSFLSRKSWIGFKRDSTKSLRLHVDDLLNWSENFEMLTIDDFATKLDGEPATYGYTPAIKGLSDEFNAQNPATPAVMHMFKGAPQPISTFEMPYKMRLSPIAEPYDPTYKGDAWARKRGEHIFELPNDLINYYNYRKAASAVVNIVGPWENSLVFKDTAQNAMLLPRFKVVMYECFDDFDKNVDLLPAAVERVDLQGLTMQPDFDRDVISTGKFKLSALGGTVNLKYRNDNPGNDHALIAWEQHSKYGRDNFVSVTFRAIDYFTAFKMEVSILAIRDFSLHVSLLPKLYSVKFAEDQKDYTVEGMQSRFPYVTIVPDPKTIHQSVIFIPQGVPTAGGTDDGVIVVAKGNGLGQLIDFNYIGTDKAGITHPFTSKMILIPAEGYKITSLAPFITPSGKKYNQTDTVNIKDIGFLNPAREQKFGGHARSCDQSNDQYMYQLIKTFSTTNRVGLQTFLDDIASYVGNNYQTFKNLLNQDVTYAKLDGLKDPQNVNKIGKDSQNSTFKTDAVLLGSDVNGPLYSIPRDDFYNDDFPILPALRTAQVIIPQIDQIQGRSEYHEVSYASEYFNSGIDIDDDKQKTNNIARIFFKINTPIANFFSANYRSSGAMLNPGVTISNVSAYDNSISYNETHNSGMAKVSASAAISSLSTSSVFRELNAQILGMPLLGLLEDFLPIGDIPVFQYAQELENDIDRVNALIAQFKDYANQWTTDYNNIQTKITGYENDVTKYTQEIKSISKNDLRNWLETILAQSGLSDRYNQKLNSLQSNLKDYKAYVTNVLNPFYQFIITLDGPAGTPKPLKDIGKQFDKLISNPTIGDLNTLLQLIKANVTVAITVQLFKEAAKGYISNVLVSAASSPAFITSVTEINSFRSQVDDSVLSYYNAFTEAIQESSDFCTDYLTGLAKKATDQISDSLSKIPVSVTDLLNGLLKSDDFQKWVIVLNRLSNIYNNYYQLHTSLKNEYYKQLSVPVNAAGIPVDLTTITTLSTDLVAGLKNNANGINLDASVTGDPKTNFDSLKTGLATLVNQGPAIFTDYLLNSPAVQPLITKASNTVVGILAVLYQDYDNVVTNLQNAQESLNDYEDQLSNFMNNELDKLTSQLTQETGKLVNAVKGSQAYQDAAAAVNELSDFINAIQSLSHQSLNYSVSTSNFREISFGGIIDFIPDPGNTTLTLDVEYQVQLNIASINSAPAITHQSFTTDTKLDNFKIGVLGLLYIDFVEVRFIAGSDVKDQFTVTIGKVDFGGCLGFMQVFEDFLKSLADDLSFDINALGASISYALKIPDFTTGYFNFFGLSLSSTLTLPFNPDGAMQISFGIGNSINKFGLTLMGIFGGQGYFQIDADPKKGIIGMDIALEFGAIFNLDIADILDGTAYLVGGIYIRKYESQYDLRAYILCAGSVNVLGLVSASVTFYLGLEGNSQVIAGRCTISISISIGPFFSISVSATLYKEIAGTKSNDNNPAPLAPQAAIQPAKASGKVRFNNIDVVDQNVASTVRYPGDQLHIVVRSPLNDKNIPTASLSGNGISKTFESQSVGLTSERLTYLTYDLTGLKAGQYDLSLSHGADAYTQQIQMVDDETPEPVAASGNKSAANSHSYFASYFKP